MITIDNLNAATGTANVTIDGVTRNLPAVVSTESIKVTGGVAVRFKTGTKVWNAGLTKWLKSGNISQPRVVNMFFRQGEDVRVVGFYSDYANQSQHVGQVGGAR